FVGLARGQQRQPQIEARRGEPAGTRVPGVPELGDDLPGEAFGRGIAEPGQDGGHVRIALGGGESEVVLTVYEVLDAGGEPGDGAQGRVGPVPVARPRQRPAMLRGGLDEDRAGGWGEMLGDL